jgi:MFS family permease
MQQQTEATRDNQPEVRARESWRTTFSPLQYSSFRYLWFSTVFASAGNWIQQVTVGWLAYDITESPFQVGLVSGFRAFPMLFAPLAGAVADRIDRRKLLMINQAGMAVLALAFAVAVLSGLKSVWPVHLFSFLMGIMWAFNNPVRQSLVASAVPRESLMTAVALNSMGFNSMRIFGPAIGGALILLLGPGANFLVQSAMYVGVLVMAFLFNPMHPFDLSRNRGTSVLSNLGEGFKYVATERTLRSIILFTMVPTLLLMAPTMSMMPAFAVEVVDAGAGGLGLLLTAAGTGGFLGTFAVAMSGGVRSRGRMTMIGATLSAIMVIVFSQMDVMWLAMMVLVFSNMFHMITLTTNNTLIQYLTPDDMRGRVTGVYMMDVGMMPLGALLAGGIAEAVGKPDGVPVAILICGVMGIGFIAVLALSSRTLWRLRI